MCDPITAGVISAGGAIYGGLSANRTARENAALLERQAVLRHEKAKVDIEAADIRARRALGSRDAAIGASGATAASFSDVIADDLATSALEKRLIKYGAAVDSANYRFQAQQQRQAGTDALIGAAFSAAGSVAGGYGRSNMMARGITIDSPWDTYAQRA